MTTLEFALWTIVGLGSAALLGRSAGWLAIAFLLFIAHPAQAQPWYYINLSWAPSETIGADCRVQYNNGGSWANYGSTVSGQYANLGNGQWTGYKFRLYRDSIGIISGETTVCYGGAGWTTNGSTLSWSFPNVDWGTAYVGEAPPTYSAGACWTNLSVRPARVRTVFSAYFPANSQVVQPGQWFCWTNSTTNGPWSHYTETYAMSDAGDFVWSNSATNSATTNGPAITGGKVDQSTPSNLQTDNQRAGYGTTNPVTGGQIQSNLVGLADQERLNTEAQLRVMDSIRSNLLSSASNTTAALVDLGPVKTNTMNTTNLLNQFRDAFTGAATNYGNIGTQAAWASGMTASGLVATATGHVLSNTLRTNWSGIAAKPSIWVIGSIRTNFHVTGGIDLNPRRWAWWAISGWVRKTLLWAIVVFAAWWAYRQAEKTVDMIWTNCTGSGFTRAIAQGFLHYFAPGVLGAMSVASLLLTAIGAIIPLTVAFISSVNGWSSGYDPFSAAALVYAGAYNEIVGELLALIGEWIPITETIMIGVAMGTYYLALSAGRIAAGFFIKAVL